MNPLIKLFGIMKISDEVVWKLPYCLENVHVSVHEDIGKKLHWHQKKHHWIVPRNKMIPEDKTAEAYIKSSLMIRKDAYLD